MRASEEFVSGLGRRTQPDRVLATILFTDIVGSTQKASDLGDSAWRNLLARHHAAVRELLA
ncbi:MAG: adenylate/guanylate cyclase domain-containing protein, partial [Actinomycetota bacterium]